MLKVEVPDNITGSVLVGTNLTWLTFHSKPILIEYFALFIVMEYDLGWVKTSFVLYILALAGPYTPKIQVG